MARIAIIGTGIAGMGCAHLLNPHHDLTMFEQDDHVGGHTNTVTVDEHGRQIPIDTGFIVYNEITYPNLTRLFAELAVPTEPTFMSFSVQHRPTGLEYSGSGLAGLFGQRRNILRPSFYRLLAQINRFNTVAPSALDDPRYAAMDLAQYVAEEKFSQEFLHQYLIPMSSAVWSTPPEKMLRFPLVSLVRFFANHGFLGLNTQHQWRTVVGGSRMYRDRLIAPFKHRIRCNAPVTRVARTSSGAAVTVGGELLQFDSVVLACHADQALRILETSTDLERRILGEFQYQTNVATLHTDPSVMPARRRLWSAWNYRVDHAPREGRELPSTVYYMNMLQHLPAKLDYFVSINDHGHVHPDRVLMTIRYEHPVFTVGAMRAQKKLPELNELGPIYYCGSYFRYGFHEDALVSAIELAATILGVHS
jgi:predicted NAD/FAD-binding protein